MSLYIEKSSDEYKQKLVEATIKILQRDYGFRDPIQIKGNGGYLLPLPPGLSFENTKNLNGVVMGLRNQHGIKAGILDMATQALTDRRVLDEMIKSL